MTDIGVILLFISMIHAYVFAILFFTFKRTSAKIMAFYMLIVFIQYLLFINVNTIQFPFFSKLLYYAIIPLSLSSHPLIFLYVKYLTKENFQLTIKSIIHFIPSIILFAIVFVMLLSMDPEEKATLFSGLNLENAENSPILNVYALSTIVLFLQILIYAIIMFRLLYKHEDNIEQLYSTKNKVSLNWLKVFVFVYSAYYVFEFILFVFKGVSISETVYFSLISLHVFFVGFMAFKQREIYIKNRNQIANNSEVIELTENSPFSHTSKLEQHEFNREDSMSKMNSEEKKAILDQLETLMIEEQLFLDPNLSLYDLSQRLQINKNYISHVLNELPGMNFYNFINQYRIESAKKLLSDPNVKDFSIEGIAQDSGFKSKSVFYKVFKQFVNETPSNYRKKHIS